MPKLFTLRSFTLLGVVESVAWLKHSSDRHDANRNTASTIALLFLFNYAVLAVYTLFIHPRWMNPLRHLVGPKKKRPPGDLYLDVVKQYPDQDLIVLSLVQGYLLVANPQLFADLLVTRSYDFIKPARVNGFLRRILGDGLIVIEGDRHKFVRKNSLPAFAFRNIKNLYPTMWTKAAKLVEVLRSEGADREEPIELRSWTSKITLDIIGVAGLGREFNMMGNANDPLLKVYEELLTPSKEKMTYAMVSIIFGERLIKMLPWRMNETFDRLSKALGEISGSLIREKREAIEKRGDDHFDILSTLIKSNNFSDSELTDQLLTFLAAGHETTSSALCWASYLLSKRPEMQFRLREEVRQAIPSDPAEQASMDMATVLESLPYLNGVINESLRLYPTAPTTIRRAVCDTQVGEHHIPSGTTFIVSMWMLNRSPEVWGPSAGEFRPERWVSTDAETGQQRPNLTGGARSNYDFMTFLHGPRSCLGQGFARAEMRCLLAAMAGAFEWELGMEESEVVPRGVITIKPGNGLYLKLKTVS